MVDEKRDIGEEIAGFAKLQFTDDEISTITGIDKSELIQSYSGYIDRGRLLAEAEVRQSILKMAVQGSTPAQKQLMELNARAKEHSKKYRIGEKSK